MLTSLNWKSVLLTFAAILTLTLTGCAHSINGNDAPLARNLPVASASMQPVPLPAIVAGQDVRVSRFDHRQALKKANKRLTSSRSWYEQVRHDYGAGR